jgi:hypothetical protein
MEHNYPTENGLDEYLKRKADKEAEAKALLQKAELAKKAAQEVLDSIPPAPEKVTFAGNQEPKPYDGPMTI